MWLYWSAFALVMAWVFGATVVWALDVFPTHVENVIAVVSLGLVCIIEAIALSVAGSRIREQQQQQDYATCNTSRPSDEPQGEAGDSNAETTQPQTKTKHYSTEENLFWDRQIVVGWVLNGITLGAAVVAISGLFLILRGINHADQGNIDANRAWLNPFFVYIGNWPLQVGQPIHFQVLYQNSGKSPAIGIRWKFDTGYFDVPPDEDGSKVKIQINQTCDGLVPDDNGPTEYGPVINAKPNENLPHTFSMMSNSHGIEHQTLIDDGMIKHSHRFFVQGCAAYYTMGIVGKSKFCYAFPLHANNGNADLWACQGSGAE